MGVGSGGQWPTWIFILSTDKAEGDLMVLFFGIVFLIDPPGNSSSDNLGSMF